MSLAQIRDEYAVPARINGRILFCGTPAVITGTSGMCLRARMLADGRHVAAGSTATLHPAHEVIYLDERTCGNCGEALLPALDFEADGPGGWLHEDGEARCALYATAEPLPGDLRTWPATETPDLTQDAAA